MTDADLYSVLGVEPDADAAAIKRAHRQLVRVQHPDKPGGDRETFERTQLAYDTLSDPEKRARYDEGGEIPGAERTGIQDIAPFVIGAFDKAIMEVQGAYQRTDIIAAMVMLLRKDIAAGQAANREQQIGRLEVQKMIGRLGFTGDGTNLIEATLQKRIAESVEIEQANDQVIAVLERAVEYVKLYGWEVDAVQPFQWQAASADEMNRYAEVYMTDAFAGMATTKPISKLKD